MWFIAFLLAVGTGVFAYHFLVTVPAQQQGLLQLEREKLQAQTKLELNKQNLERQDKEQMHKRETQKAQYLTACEQKAENDYWRYVKLNGREDPDQNGVYWGVYHLRER